MKIKTFIFRCFLSFIFSTIFGFSLKICFKSIFENNLKIFLFSLAITSMSLYLVIRLIRSIYRETFKKFFRPVYVIVKIGYGGQETYMFETENLILAKMMAEDWHEKDPERILGYLDYAVLRKTDDEYVYFSSGRWNVSA